MRIELIPLILGAFVALLGVVIIFDAWSPDADVAEERRRRPRVERNRSGEALIGFGVLALAATFVGRDTWRFTTLVSIIGAAFLVLGAILNGSYIRELFRNRGPLRRREVTDDRLGEDAIVSRPVHSDPAPRDASTAVPPRADAPPPNAPETNPGGYTGVERRSRPRGERRQ